MRWGWLVCVAVGCGMSPGSTARTDPRPPESLALRIEPASPEIVVELDVPSGIGFRVIDTRSDGSEVDVTADAAWALAGAPLGTLAQGGFTSDGRTGGEVT